MARRRGKGGGNPQTNPEGLGVGALASQPLQHGERGMVESLAATPPPTHAPQPGGGGQPQPMGGGLPSPEDLLAPTQRPDEPLTAGMPLGPGAGPDPMLAEDPGEFLRALYEAARNDPALSGAAEDIRMLLEGLEF